MELVKVGERTYYIKNATNIGIYLQNEKEVYLIDTGNDKDAGKKILKIIEEQGWTVKGIINTHSHADHIGGNKVIQDRTSCSIYSHGIESCFINYPVLEPTFLYGSHPFKDLENKFLEAKPSVSLELDSHLPEGLSYFELKGHTFDMIGIKTSDNVYFLGDALCSEEALSKYGIFFLENVQEYLTTLTFLSTLEGNCFIPSHGEMTSDITSLITLNRTKIEEILSTITTCCMEAKTQEEILKYLFEHYQLAMNINQYYLIGSTLKAYISYLLEQEKLNYFFKENKLYFQAN